MVNKKQAVELKLWGKWVLYFSSHTLIVLILLALDFNWLTFQLRHPIIVGLPAILVLVCFLLVALIMRNLDQSDTPYKIIDASRTERIDRRFAFSRLFMLMAALVTLEVGGSNAWVILGCVLLSNGFLFISTGWLSIINVLNLLGYKLYEVEIERDQRRHTALCLANKRPIAGEFVRSEQLSDDLIVITKFYVGL